MNQNGTPRQEAIVTVPDSNETRRRMDNYVRYGRNEIRHVMSEIEELDEVSRAVEREREIRIGMARTGEGREVFAESLDAQAAMDDEVVLELTDGNPTTLVDAIKRYVDGLRNNAHSGNLEEVADDLTAILAFPWPEDERRVQLHNPHYGMALHVTEEENRDLVIRMGNNRWEVYRVNWEDAGSDGQRECQAVAEAVYRATLARVIPDREHIVTLNAAETAQLCRWLNGEHTGSNWIGDRLTVNAAGNGVWIRTRPYSNQNIPRKEGNIR